MYCTSPVLSLTGPFQPQRRNKTAGVLVVAAAAAAAAALESCHINKQQPYSPTSLPIVAHHRSHQSLPKASTSASVSPSLQLPHCGNAAIAESWPCPVAPSFAYCCQRANPRPAFEIKPIPTWTAQPESGALSLSWYKPCTPCTCFRPSASIRRTLSHFAVQSTCTLPYCVPQVASLFNLLLLLG